MPDYTGTSLCILFIIYPCYITLDLRLRERGEGSRVMLGYLGAE